MTALLASGKGSELLDQNDQFRALPQFSAARIAPPPAVSAGPVAQVHCDAEGRLGQDIPCRGCGYNLRGLHLHGVCPECGVPVGRSIRGDLLMFSDPNWVEQLARGMMVVIAAVLASITSGVIIAIVVMFLTMSAMAAGGSSSIKTATIVAASVGFVIAMVQTFGYWLLTGPDPGTAVDKDDKWRVIARYTLLTTALSAPFQAMWGSRGGMGGMKALASSAAVPPWVTALAAVSLVLMGVQLVGYFSIATHLRRLALRVPNRRLAGQTRVVMWGFIATQLMSIAMMAIIVLMVKQIGANPSNVAPPIFITYGAVSCSYGLGMLVFGIWAIVLMFGHRRAFSIAATQARSTWARDPLAATPFRVGAIAPPTQDVPPAGATM